MMRVLNSKETFVDEALIGLADAFATRVRRAPGGVIRSTTRRPSKVSVVIGGGSGHYPAFAGMVGEGLADAAVCGNVFASPSTRQVIDICTAVDTGAGCFISFGNYAGDVLNFGAAAARLRAGGMPVEYLAVTDDIVSAPKGDEGKRRGVAGDLIVFKVAGAAAEEGAALATVARVAALANDRTRSFGVAFAGCTLPGADEPLFTLPEGMMGVGLGVHGEPGVGEEPIPTADQLADDLVARLLPEAPHGVGTRVAVLLNGLGTVKYEELFVLWAAVAQRLRAAGLTLVAPEVGELITSLDMAGCSLTICWLDDELERLWLAPCDSPAFRRTVPVEQDTSPVAERAALPPVQPASEVGQASGRIVVTAISAIATLLHEQEGELGRLDAIAGDGDHGRGMVTGVDAALTGAVAASEAGGDGPTVLRHAGEEWADKAGGTSGALWGAGLLGVAEALPADAPIAFSHIVSGMRRALDTIVAVGGAEVGDKTLVDALAPFVTSLEEGADPSAWADAVRAAEEAAAGTADIAARRGRSRVLGNRSLGTPDPGATSLAMCLKAIEPLIAGTEPKER